MTSVLLTGLGALSALCGYSAAHHLSVGLRRPVQPVHLLLAAMSAVITGYALAKLGGYSAKSAEELVLMRRWEISLAMLFFALLPWFVAACTNVWWRTVLWAFTIAYVLVFLPANLISPYGLVFVEPPQLQLWTLPWGEKVADLRVHQRTGWYQSVWLGILLEFAYGAYACVIQYRGGKRYPSLMLATALGVLFGFLAVNHAVNLGLLRLPHTAELGFVALILLMSWTLGRVLRAAGEALKVSEARLRTLVDQSPFGIQVLAADGRTLRVNPAWEALWGVRGDAPTGGYNILEDRRLIDQGGMPYIERAFAGAATQIPLIVYHPAETPEVPGGPVRDRWVRAFVYPVKEESGRVTEVILMHEDITESRQVQEAMEMLARTSSAMGAEEFFRPVVEKLAKAYGARFAFIGVLLESKQAVRTVAVWAGDRIAENFEYQLEGTPCNDVLNRRKELIPRDAAKAYPDDAMLVEMGVESYFGAPLISSTGDTLGLIAVMDAKPMELTPWTAPILGTFASRATAELQRFNAEDALRDHQRLLEQRVAERTAQLAAANRELDAFCHSVSHDLRAPLRAMQGFSAALREDCGTKLDDECRRHLQRIQAAGEKMDRLIADLLQLSRVTRAELHRAPVDLAAVARDVAKELQQSAPERQRKVEWVVPAHCWARGDTHLLAIALDNLLGNAWKFTRERSAARIEFGVRTERGKEVYYVKDNGAGFNMEYADKLFKP